MHWYFRGVFREAPLAVPGVEAGPVEFRGVPLLAVPIGAPSALLTARPHSEQVVSLAPAWLGWDQVSGWARTSLQMASEQVEEFTSVPVISIHIGGKCLCRLPVLWH